MPYVKPELRAALDAGVKQPEDAGELNYAVTMLVLKFLAQGKPSYARYNAAIGALECCKLELYRRLVSPYENAKRAENGDVYP